MPFQWLHRRFAGNRASSANFFHQVTAPMFGKVQRSSASSRVGPSGHYALSKHEQCERFSFGKSTLALPLAQTVRPVRVERHQRSPLPLSEHRQDIISLGESTCRFTRIWAVPFSIAALMLSLVHHNAPDHRAKRRCWKSARFAEQRCTPQSLATIVGDLLKGKQIVGLVRRDLRSDNIKPQPGLTAMSSKHTAGAGASLPINTDRPSPYSWLHPEVSGGNTVCTIQV